MTTVATVTEDTDSPYALSHCGLDAVLNWFEG